MDKFAENAFKDALKEQNEQEFAAWMKFSDTEFMLSHMTAVAQVGIEKINKLCGAAIKAGEADTLAQYAHHIMMLAFHGGYKARMEEER